MADSNNNNSSFNAQPNHQDSVDNKAKSMFGFDFSKMMDPSYYKEIMGNSNIDASKFFDPAQVKNYFESLKNYNLDTSALFDLQQKNINAIVEANKKSATGYQEVMQKQIKMLEESMNTVKSKMTAATSQPNSGNAASVNAQDASQAMEKVMNDMSELVNGVQKANMEAASIISDRIEKNFYDFKSIIQKAA